MWGFTRRRTNFKVQKGHTERINKFHHWSSLRERERDREIENNHVRKIPRAIYKLYDLFWPDCSEIFKALNIHVCFKMGHFLSFLKSRKTYSVRTFSLISLSFITPLKNKRITWHSLLHRRFYLFIRCFIDLWGGNVCGTWPGNRLSTRRNTQDNKFCLWMSVHRLVHVASTCNRKKKHV